MCLKFIWSWPCIFIITWFSAVIGTLSLSLGFKLIELEIFSDKQILKKCKLKGTNWERLISHILTNGQNWKWSQIIAASKYADKRKACSYPHGRKNPVYLMPKSRHAFSVYATFICSWWKKPLMHRLEREQNKHFVA